VLFHAYGRTDGRIGRLSLLFNIRSAGLQPSLKGAWINHSAGNLNTDNQAYAVLPSRHLHLEEEQQRKRFQGNQNILLPLTANDDLARHAESLLSSQAVYSLAVEACEPIVCHSVPDVQGPRGCHSEPGAWKHTVTGYD
jgi:hypothetical protein